MYKPKQRVEEPESITSLIVCSGLLILIIVAMYTLTLYYAN